MYRLAQIFAREGVDLDRSVLARWVGEASKLMGPLVETLRRYVMSTDKLHGDDTPLPVLEPGRGRTRIARFWTYVRDSRPSGDAAPPAVWFSYSPDRKGEHPQRHLAKFRGILQADAFAGFNKLYATGAIQEAPCMAHIRRKYKAFRPEDCGFRLCSAVPKGFRHRSAFDAPFETSSLEHLTAPNSLVSEP